VKDRVKEIGNDPEAKDELAVLKQWLKLSEQESKLKKAVKELDAQLDQLAHDHYAKLSVAEIKTLVVDDKWLARLTADLQGELDRVGQTLTARIRELAERYATPLPQLVDEVASLSIKVDEHLKRMGAVWK
jgi:type I restriction enzyme M protein